MEYNKREIEQLLERWENGETTLAEEAELKRLLSDAEVCAMLDEGDEEFSLEVESCMFDYFNSAAQETTENRVSIPEEKPVRVKGVFGWLHAAVIAAAVAIAVTVSLTTQNNFSQEEYYCQVNGIGISDPEIANEQLETALSLISASLEMTKTDHYPIMQNEELENVLTILNLK